MNQLPIVDYSGQRVLMTSQLAQSYGTDERRISENYNRNKERYKVGKHFFFVHGDELKSFKEAYPQIAENLKFAPSLILWTEKGAWLQAKSLNTDQAWEAYETLVDDYYRVKEMQIDLSLLTPEMQMFKLTFDAVAKVQLEAAQTKQELIGLQTTVSTIKETFLQRDDNWRQDITRLLNRAASRLGGFREVRTESYRLLEERGRCNLNIRVANLKERLAESGATKTKINDANRLDVIESDPRLKEIYTTIVKELSIGTLV
ncbi:ORF6N domain-containing protein [Paenibacillus sp. BR1-192]|uniref:ORF6N domain-containing protein n=1 Tax=Paenibacillus sp. BR1-192 TaxID=3032287 RepID=UPI00240D4AE9|nr:ORF6N domain-containing protein [Paenibacillus sp. BR1-192]WFB57513.1 ORF6N domain-containing protein [Paenibacillus sp. BR1-192]